MRKQPTDGHAQGLARQIEALIDKLHAQNRRLTKENKDLKDENAVLRDCIQKSERDSPDEDSGVYVEGWRCFHRPNCKWISDGSGKRREFSHQEAIDAGLKPCKSCCA